MGCVGTSFMRARWAFIMLNSRLAKCFSETNLFIYPCYFIMLGQALALTSDQGITVGLSTLNDAKRFTVALTKVH